MKKASPQLVLLPPLPTAAVTVATTTAGAAALVATLIPGGGVASWAAVATAAAAAAVLTTLAWPRLATDVFGLHGTSFPSPTSGRSWPLLGRLPQLLAASRKKALAHLYVDWQRDVGWGVNYQIYTFGRRSVVLVHPDDVRAVTMRMDAPRDRQRLRHFGTPLSADMIFIVPDPRHSNARRLVHPFLSGTPTTETVLRVVNETLWGVHPHAVGAGGAQSTTTSLPRWAAHLEEHADSGKPMDVDDLATSITVEVIFNLLFSTSPDLAELNVQKERMIRLINDTTALVGLPAPELLGPARMASLRAAGNRFLDQFQRIAARRRAAYADGSASAHPPRDLLDIMLADMDKPGGTGAYEGDQRRMGADMLFYVLAGYDTTAHSIAWTVHAVLDHPDVEARLVAELNAALPPPGQPITAAHLDAMPYADAVWKEALRLFPPAPNGTIRRLEADLRLPSNGAVIPAGTVVHLPVLPVHRNPKAYPSPSLYDPARWLPPTANGGGSHTLASQRTARSHYAAFSSGPRSCPGQNMAAVEAKAVLAVLFHRYRWERVGKAADVVLENAVTMRPAGLQVTLHRRQAAGA
ncbi:hypothetical protein MMPV_000989 [Pyropia vietnamensis]